MDLTLLARWAAVGATLLAVFVALLKEQLQSLFWKPEFKVEIGTRPPFCVKTQSSVFGTGLDGTTRFLWSGSIYWARLWVQNVGARRAEAAEVFVTRFNVLIGTVRIAQSKDLFRQTSAGLILIRTAPRSSIR